MWVNKILTNLLSKLVLLNSLVIILVILVAGISVKDYACYLVNSENVVGDELIITLNGFLWKVGILAFFIAGLFHIITVYRIVSPIKHLSLAAEAIKDGKTPPIVDIKSSGEIKGLIENFNSMSETLRSVHEQRENMLRDIAHELRTPLTNINGYLEALQNEVITGDPELFGSLLEESRRITRIVELITELNSWNNELFLDKEFGTVEINKVLTDSLKTYQLKLNRQFKDIFATIEEATVLGNRDGLIQVFTNIIQNIIDYNTGETLTIDGRQQGKKYIITFGHTGQFIDIEKKDLIFERFYRLEESRSTKSSGAGLGLAIAKSIVLAHKGKMGVDTTGTNHTFWISLPIL